MTITLPHQTVLLHTPSGPVHLSREGQHTASLTEIPSRQGEVAAFHPYSTGAAVADYVAYVMTLQEGPFESRQLLRMLMDNTAAGKVSAQTLNASLTRDPRFIKVSRGIWSLQDPPALDDVESGDDDLIDLEPESSCLMYQIDTRLHGRTQLRRTLQVPADATLLDLHHALQTAYGWSDEHLNQFRIGDTEYEARTADPTLGEGAVDAATVQLDQALSLGQTGIYLYDWRARWRVVLCVTGAVLVPTTTPRFQCLNGMEQAIPEAFFGEDEYARVLNAMRAAPDSPAGQKGLKRLGPSYDPAAFNVDALNAELGRRFP
ncbi:plasmid pRiA4b ORF-3 family protein [Deinococcus multiflagellatus]|uniref:Plasmid pRiA4b ORF-3 family protein n=1 Tax=Deinococcus multiflagellatus TaxID=1656887 RepID=A0ABW1ZQ39_9DEIO|nr:plasmid pRiA4b ORF-3 family protein [Deinococcus multiflagellatus]MBZ9714937.1 plasmid pRiA4b ORF-3 family protein [Deinococcus multiflagellatus]